MDGMSYSSYADPTKQSVGRQLFYLDHYCPLHMVEQVIFGGGSLALYGRPFATVTWEDGAPLFHFAPEWTAYDLTQQRRRPEAMENEREIAARRRGH